VLVLLWRGIAAYLVMHRARYVLGCSSLASQNEAEGLSLFEALKSAHFAPADFRTSPWPDHQCRRPAVLPDPPRVPGLFGAYLSLGAFVAAEPAIDRVFGTIDFLTFLDLRCLDRRAAHAYLGSPWAELLTEFAEP
jgi:putative hemolysin